ncbi:MAG: flagellar filament capping protein FliD [Lachnospiraceae bacterium]|nr:flagellar filament capping protein FliD [Lachnospiraceae bacterium]
MSSGIRMSGMVSGIDTEAIVQAMVSTHVAKKEKYQKAQTKLEWKQEAYKAINTKVNSLYNKISSLRFSSAYNLKKTTVSDPTKATITASGTAINGTQTLQITQLAKSGYLTGGTLASGTTEDTTLGELGYTGGETTISVRMADGSQDIRVSKDTKISELITELNKTGVKASFDAGNGRIFVSAKATGTANDFSMTASDETGLKALAAFGLSVESKANTAEYEKMASYAKATDAETKAYITEILTNLKTARDSNADLAIEKASINKKIAYSDAKDAVTQYQADQGDDEQKQKDADLLLKLLKEPASAYKYVTEDGEVKEDFEFKAGENSLENTIKKLAKSTGLITTTTAEDGTEKEDTSKLDALRQNYNTVIAIDDDAVLTEDDKKAYYLTEDERTQAKERLTEIDTLTADNNKVINDPTNSYWDVKDYTDVDIDTLADEITAKVMYAKAITDGTETIPVSKDATRVDAQDAKIVLNNATFTSDSNVFNINGLTIKATGETKAGESITINTDTDTQGMYDKIKDFLSEYNSLINELSSLYNADSASKYEPLTDDEKAEMSESEIEKWETKIKDAILRKDSTIGGVMNAMTSAMMGTYEINGKTYSLGSFGIQTLGYLNAAKNQNYAYHIDGDSEDDVTAGKTDKLLDMITNEPEVVEEFMKNLTTDLYKALDEKMGATTLSSRYSIYNDKQMTKDYDNYTKLIKTWEDKIADMEDRYYKQYSNMEKQLAKMQSATSSLSGLLGGSQ